MSQFAPDSGGEANVGPIVRQRILALYAQSERAKEHGERLAAELADTQRLQQISTLLIQEGNVDALYRQVLNAAIGLMRSDMASMQMLDHDRGELRLLGWKGFHPESAAFWEWVRLDSGSTCGAALCAGRRVIVRDVETCEFMTGTADLDAYRKSGIRAVQSTPLIARSGRLLGMISTHWREPHQPPEPELLHLDVLARQAADLIERANAETVLRENEERFRALVDASAQIVWTMDAEGVVVEDSPSWRAFTGQTFDQWTGWGWTNALHPDDRDRVAELWRTAVAGSTAVNAEYRVWHVSGEWRWTSVRAVPLRKGDGRVRGWVGMNCDITERKQSEEQIAILAREADHRAKNLLATVQATVHLSQSDTPHGLKQAIEGRIQALANVQRLFVHSRWLGAELHSLVAQEMAPYCQNGETRARIDGPELLLEPSMAQTIAITLHELATNAAKYGALSAPDGRVQVEWSRASDGRLLLRWTEMGGPLVKPPTLQGFGTRVMECMLRQSKGAIHFDWRSEGLACEIAIRA